MLNLLRSEWYKLCRNRSFWLLLSLLFASAVIYVLLNYYDDPNDGGALTGMSGLDLFASSMGANNYIIKIGLSVLAGFFLSSEYSTGTIKRAVASGYSRSKFITAKLLVFIVGAMLTALVFPLVNILLGSVLFGRGDLSGGISETGFIVRSFVLTLSLAAAFAAVTGAIATFLTDSGKTIGTVFVLYFFADGLYAMTGKFLPFVNTLYDYSIFNLITHYADPDMSGSDFAQSVSISLLVAIAFVGIGIAVFRRKEIK
ncbi:ABC transporter permease subunit [Paenibacillus sacheonensis]|uniref:ABC transporter permease subunit n=1 Tax=Paenibacillus sacheonensis TaxID=742054 RepID=A0A7X4YLV9_9BACL|nr:ABC transporter permease subunit [Paenibacillus sacheonensis]MBM7565917.1 ABC-2 type transport system permease protein [Paenibacillus sacheonensis]NBC68768.1 ABC transporter permease subunit [Paenibacillus sacheonensis]